MIPWRLKFSGVRDYPPTLLDLSGEDAHVMITGPNGSGKSTITFCMGAVLYSAKVDIEGLKSRNLEANQTWKAAISFLFKNEGANKIDAPDYVEFTLKIVQEPGQPIKKEYSISTGENIDEWEEEKRYTSGDRFYNFTSYKNDLKYKYKVDPDHYYLIWYQQEVNQFAVMHPEERFRIFSEMHGIDKVQRDWEESMEKVKEAEETSRASETNVKLKKAELGMAKNAFDRYTDNQRRLYEGGKLYAQSLLGMEASYQKQVRELAGQVEQTHEDIHEENEELARIRLVQDRLAWELTDRKEMLQSKEAEHEQEERILQDIKDQIKSIQVKIHNLEDELEDITKRKSQMTRTEAEVKAELERVKIRQQEIEEALKQKDSELNKVMNCWQEGVQVIAGLEQEIKQIDSLETIHKARLAEYMSSHHVQMTIDQLNRTILDNRDRHDVLRKEKLELQAELSYLKEGQNVSYRQRESLAYFKDRGVQAFPLSALLEMEERVNPREEQLFQAIKYTVFFDGRKAVPPNDLYHVPLSLVIPDQVRMSLPNVPLKVKGDLRESMLPHAMKALWWVAQLFEDGLPEINGGMLTDSLGIRGPQEKERLILSQKAIRLRKQEVENQVDERTDLMRELDASIAGDTKLYQKLNGIIHQVKESEAFMLAEHEHARKRERLKALVHERDELEGLRRQHEQKKQVLTRKQIEDKLYQDQLEEEASFYLELGKMKEKYEELHQLNLNLTNEKRREREQKLKLELLEEELDKLEQIISKAEKEARNVAGQIDDSARKLEYLAIQADNQKSDQDAAEFGLMDVKRELEDLKQVALAIYEEAAQNVDEHNLSALPVLKSERESGKITFDLARNEAGIDPAAPQNYETVKKEYERFESEYTRTKLLLEQDKERMEKLRDQLETTISMRVIEIQQRFKNYMSQFQFEGDISWDSFEDRRKRTHFQLFIKARKEGHRGSLEDVSVKARGGKVGKGVSGGEESLSSLLFALCLLQNLQITPGFIILDEFDSALDENRKVKVFDLYEKELQRKLIILTPKSHENEYLNRFSKAFVVRHDPRIPESRVAGILKKERVEH